MKTDVELVEQIIRDKKSSLFLRHSSATEKDIKHLAEYLYTELIDPFLAARSVEPIKEAGRQIKAMLAETNRAAKGVVVYNYAQEEFPFQ